MSPSWRKPAGVFAILAAIILWAVLVASLAGLVGRWPVLLQALFYAIAGIIWLWLFPLKALLRWTETGCWRPLERGDD